MLCVSPGLLFRYATVPIRPAVSSAEWNILCSIVIHKVDRLIYKVIPNLLIKRLTSPPAEPFSWLLLSELPCS